MGRRMVFDVRRDGRRVVLRRLRPAVWRLTWLLLAVPVGVGAAVGSWHVVGVAAGQVARAAYTVVVFALVVGMVRLMRGGRR
ncbi:MAG TPA: hypothetical protein VFX70_12685 [Mycobacteriales bacterium]|nr:hypothetical protein [Mycobacteriales bacterium]